ncbi:hypothetical protein [Halomarina litorea]|uniref:hypothetical protein n=1 Tax=Halomarina litorea TaxID=2961595 RepID=UPI0020C4F5B3|nr:hypothetical protein [Halomarina sp. BCD28]
MADTTGILRPHPPGVGVGARSAHLRRHRVQFGLENFVGAVFAALSFTYLAHHEETYRDAD